MRSVYCILASYVCAYLAFHTNSHMWELKGALTLSAYGFLAISFILMLFGI